MKKNIIELGDSLKLLKDIDDNSIDLIITDPPYGINYHNNRRKIKGKLKTEKGILNDKDNLTFLDNILKELFRVLKSGHHIYWFGRYDSIAKQIPLFEKNGFKIKNNLIWLKNNHGTGDLYYSYASKYECILYALKPGKKNRKLNKVDGKTRHTDILEFKKVSSKLMQHDHQKPTDLIEFLLKKSSNENELILDPFIGSGSTVFSCINTNRNFIGFELDKEIYNNTKRKLMENRFKIFTQKEEEIGKSFASIFNKKFFKNNSDNITKIDGIINNIPIELQELRYKKSINNFNILVDVISVFYFKDKKRRYINLNNKDLKITKYGKIFTLPDNSIYLIYINKNNIDNNNIDNFNNFLQTEKYVFIPISVKRLKEYFFEIKPKIIVNNKNELKDTWESAFSILDLKKLLTKNIILDKITLQKLLN